MQQGTRRSDAVEEEVRDVQLPREGAFVFSVSGYYSSEDGALSWDFCGENGGIGERLHFHMEHGVCKPDFLEFLDTELSCADETDVGVALTAPVKDITASPSLKQLRTWMHAGVLSVAMLMAVAFTLFLIKRPSNPLVDAAKSPHKPSFARLDATEHDVAI